MDQPTNAELPLTIHRTNEKVEGVGIRGTSSELSGKMILTKRGADSFYLPW